MTPVLLLDVVGLTAKTLSAMPSLQRLAFGGGSLPLRAVLPAVTCTVQSTMLTGTLPREHGIVGNGWYFKGVGDVLLWRQHNALVQREKMWETARREREDYRAVNICWWYAMGMSTDLTVTPRPIYHSDGRKSPDCYTFPGTWHDRLTGELGEFPLFKYWGPGASIASTDWIIGATRIALRDIAPDLTMAYLPHLDYDLQRFGPDSPQADAAAARLDTALAPLLRDAQDRGITVVAVSGYGISRADRPVDINRRLRLEGLLNVYVQDGREQLDPWTSRAFAVADHQVAHVYVADPGDVPRVRDVLRDVTGVDEVLDRAQQAAYGLDHDRSGDLVAVAEPGAWFTYYFWLDNDRAPEYARGVDIHRKPGYDPAELFLDPADRWAKAKAAGGLLRKKIGMRYAMNVIPLDPSCVRGTHGRLPETVDETPVIITSRSDLLDGPTEIGLTDIRDLVLRAHRAAGAVGVANPVMRPASR